MFDHESSETLRRVEVIEKTGSGGHDVSDGDSD